MTPIRTEVVRLTGAINRGRLLVAKMAPEGMWIKGFLERWSSAYLVPWGALDDLGARLKARRDQTEKEQRKKKRRRKGR